VGELIVVLCEQVDRRRDGHSLRCAASYYLSLKEACPNLHVFTGILVKHVTFGQYVSWIFSHFRKRAFIVSTEETVP
jgi:hypothetical protein